MLKTCGPLAKADRISSISSKHLKRLLVGHYGDEITISEKEWKFNLITPKKTLGQFHIIHLNFIKRKIRDEISGAFETF